ncbi:MAG: hypothetical protein G3M78_06615 [Candidatus Nitrohelix vancouverensis]|uniref:Uncharacterized protein n=1 Tax=Candidatus Nitrohelix vancouverensis TaxID=2705534 RepID=A0A7T0C205_9BACT|nr:MAG: hypothetical protein G3M78_06615 [Candidatus Nitrohelix vancouverensis]
MEPGEIQSFGSQQGANRSKLITQATQLPDDPFQALSLETKTTKELGGLRSPLQLISVGGKEINSAAATTASIPPEIGKGSIANLFL